MTKKVNLLGCLKLRLWCFLICFFFFFFFFFFASGGDRRYEQIQRLTLLPHTTSPRHLLVISVLNSKQIRATIYKSKKGGRERIKITTFVGWVVKADPSHTTPCFLRRLPAGICPPYVLNGCQRSTRQPQTGTRSL